VVVALVTRKIVAGMLTGISPADPGASRVDKIIPSTLNDSAPCGCRSYGCAALQLSVRGGLALMLAASGL